MKFYLVGGAVRDELLNYPVTERDWVVVGASPQEMLDAGYTPVGKDFPVFLHPKSKEEYALARTERKTGPGYTGFEFYAAKDISLEDDLVRRDLTINAIAKDEQGNIVDPYNGQQDLRNKILRHVSPAFAEDPVRILRIARFAARYAHLGFTIAEETNQLMRDMVANGEVDHLVGERIWKETSRALMERQPHVFVEALRDCDALVKIMPEVDALFGVPQRPEHHPEVDTGIHTMMSLSQAVKLNADLDTRFAVLTHDLGKAKTPQELLPRHHQHETRSLPLVEALSERICAPKSCKTLALLVAEFHTHCHRALQLKPKTIVSTLEKLDAFRRPERFRQFLLACEADSRGRTGFEQRDYPQSQYLNRCFESAQQVDVKALLDQGYQGAELGEQIRAARIHYVKALISELDKQ